MKVKGIIDEDFVNFKFPSMFISTCYCDWKCCIEANVAIEVCQNCELSQSESYEISTKEIYERYMSNQISESIVFGGLEPIKQKDDILNVIKYFRNNGCNDTIVIYTGYYKNEILTFIKEISKYPNIIMKFGRFIPNEKGHYDKVLGITLASKNQYAEQIS